MLCSGEPGLCAGNWCVRIEQQLPALYFDGRVFTFSRDAVPVSFLKNLGEGVQ